jgi:hypothetical protein
MGIMTLTESDLHGCAHHTRVIAVGCADGALHLSTTCVDENGAVIGSVNACLIDLLVIGQLCSQTLDFVFALNLLFPFFTASREDTPTQIRSCDHCWWSQSLRVEGPVNSLCFYRQHTTASSVFPAESLPELVTGK